MAMLTEDEVRAIVRDEMSKHGPLDPMYTFEVACSAVPCSPRSLSKWLKLGGFAPRYSFQLNVRYRMIPASQLRWIREQMFRAKRRVSTLVP